MRIQDLICLIHSPQDARVVALKTLPREVIVNLNSVNPTWRTSAKGKLYRIGEGRLLSNEPSSPVMGVFNQTHLHHVNTMLDLCAAHAAAQCRKLVEISSVRELAGAAL